MATSTMMQRQYSRQMRPYGFTIVELMIVVAIVTILTTIAMPSYFRAGAKSDRSIAIADINEISQALERYFTYNRVYSNDFGVLSMGAAGARSITDDGGKYTYSIGIPPNDAIGSVPPAAIATGQTYVIYAQPAANGSRDTWTLSQNHMGFQQSYAKDDPTTPVVGWPH